MPYANQGERHVRLVLDTNIVVSGLLWYGAPRRVLDSALEGAVTLYTSSILLDELADVLLRDKLARVLAANQTTADFLMQRYAMLANLTHPQPIAPTVIYDPDDDHVLACALASPADYIVSGDSDLLLKSHRMSLHQVPRFARHDTFIHYQSVC